MKYSGRAKGGDFNKFLFVCLRVCVCVCVCRMCVCTDSLQKVAHHIIGTNSTSIHQRQIHELFSTLSAPSSTVIILYDGPSFSFPLSPSYSY